MIGKYKVTNDHTLKSNLMLASESKKLFSWFHYSCNNATIMHVSIDRERQWFLVPYGYASGVCLLFLPFIYFTDLMFHIFGKVAVQGLVYNANSVKCLMWRIK